MTEIIEKLADCGTLQGLDEPRRQPEIALEASPQEVSPPQAACHAKPSLPSSSDCDVIFGTKAIAHWLGLTYEQVRPLIDDKTVPTFKLPGHTKRCALKSALNEAFRKYANRRPIANAGPN